jgi:hypothetical protein
MLRSNRLFTAFATLALLLSKPAVLAAQTVVVGTVEAVQAPAWRDRNGVAVPLAAGMELQNGDVLRTGSDARAYLMLAEGSRVKLGEAAQFKLHSNSLRPQWSFHGALDLLAGAFRFTTGKLRKVHQRSVMIRVGTATIGIRGTDVWGRTDANADMVALLEGRIEIARAGQSTEMNQPMTYFDAPRGRAAEVKMLDPEFLSTLARQTEILAGDGAAGARGKWRVLIATASEDAALELYDQIREAGFAANIRPSPLESGGWRYEVLLRGFSSTAEAEVAAARLRAATGLKASVGR